MRAWIFQDPKRKAIDGDKCPWSVGWYDAAGKRKGKKIGAKSTAEKFKRKVEAEVALGPVPSASSERRGRSFARGSKK